MTDGQLVGIVLLLAMAVVLVVGIGARFRRVSREWALLAAEEKVAREWTDTPIYTATARALADTTAEFRDRAEAGRALVGKGLTWRR